MSRNLTGAGCLSRVTPSAAQPIWITDAILADAFRRFTHASRRYGSNVPGPLEAQRRATKRRNTSLAHRTTESGPIDVALLFPSRGQNLRWQMQPEPEDNLTPSLLPRWLFPVPEPPARDTVPTQADPMRKRAKTKWADIEPQISLNTAFRQCADVQDVHKLLVKREIDLRKNVPVGNALFSAVLKEKWSPTKVAQFLTDPGLNPTGTRNYITLMDHVQSRSKTNIYRRVESWNILHHAMCRAVKLGLLPPQDIGFIVSDLFTLELDHGSGPLKRQSMVQVRAQTMELLTNLDDSRVLSIDDLPESIRIKLFPLFLDGLPSPTALKLLMRLMHTIQSTERNLYMANMIVSWLSKQSDRELFLGRGVADFILALPWSSILQLVSTVTEMLLLATRQDKSMASAFQSWAAFLPTLDSYKESGLPLTKKAVEHICQGFSSQLNPREKLLASLWVARALHFLRVDFHHLEAFANNLDFRAELQGAFASTNGDLYLGPLANLVLALESLPLPHKKSFLFKIARLMRDEISSDAETIPTQTYDSATLQQNLAHLGNDTIYLVAKAVFNHQLTRLCESTVSDLEAFKQVARTLISSDSDNFKIVTRALGQNRIFKLGLAQCRKDRSAWRDVIVTDGPIIVRQNAYVEAEDSSAQPIRRLPPPVALLDVINHIAVYFATETNEVPAQTAFNRVRWCYRYLRRHRAPVSPVITRCLWHTGVTRRGVEGCSKTQWRWIYKQVRMVEGRRVARMLTWNSEYRLHRRKTLERVIADKEADERGDVDREWTPYNAGEEVDAREETKMKETARGTSDGSAVNGHIQERVNGRERNFQSRKGGWIDMADIRPVREGQATAG